MEAAMMSVNAEANAEEMRKAGEAAAKEGAKVALDMKDNRPVFTWTRRTGNAWTQITVPLVCDEGTRAFIAAYARHRVVDSLKAREAAQ